MTDICKISEFCLIAANFALLQLSESANTSYIGVYSACDSVLNDNSNGKVDGSVLKSRLSCLQFRV